ncbi:acetyl/propionyl/methylcrotonyl-CoA carboxylase subunit alpha [Motiliproteus sp. MSK22-1]|uniref:acetyl-CoA carboxylase biotin carboxylase subunit n=1 Tax=Motiliproteus sp. MSK22-1 TaxID=1897630 RepID=UPI000975625E|nr:acetyl/propionyl/methylcrotonyl-CoA carboxylase subunit alpha [Motiliproteus sp. MSK22-1]OMH37602.1 3-methylcrotonyl-CoA carboxylase [Motiliproteus sp. MSK22-1]
MFNKILIANRGEIACRIIDTAHRMGIQCVAVYSEADRNARHVALADEAFLLGPAPSKDSYLKSDLILQIAKQSGAQAIHPGYGFLSENADFARACESNNIEFIGPPASAIDSMGSKSAAKSIMESANVPLVPGYHGDDQSRELIKNEANRCGYPVLLKAVAGGGGKGMRVVWQESEFDEAFNAARREGESSFGNGDLLVEKYLTKPRHVELQVFADKSGHAVYLADRDCSVQRRHQKVIEEAPAPDIPEDIRCAMGQAAIQAARAINYVGAGTVEFLYDEDGSFYFMEMNTRLQVEHPVSELITRQDLVEWQLRVAAGEDLPLAQEQIQVEGHAIEVRVYAEDPDNDFLPATGTLKYLRTPTENRHVRVDTGVIEGDEVSIYYDPMIAKLIVWDESRDQALSRMSSALKDYQICGLTTNLNFLSNLVQAPAFKAFDVDTGFIEKNQNVLFGEADHNQHQSIALAACYLTLDKKRRSSNPQDPTSPFNQLNNWRLNSSCAHPYELVHGDNSYQVNVLELANGFEITLNNTTYEVKGKLEAEQLTATLNGHQFSVSVFQDGQELTLFQDGHTFTCQRHVEMFGEHEDDTAGSLCAPMNGTVVAILKEPGSKVEAGEGLIVIEAMKMEQTIAAPYEGTVTELFYQPGDLVNEGSELLALTPVSENNSADGDA